MAFAERLPHAVVTGRSLRGDASSARVAVHTADEPGELVPVRTAAERHADPERLNLDSRELSRVPWLGDEPQLRLLNLHGNRLVRLANLTPLTSLIFLDLSANALERIAGLETLASLRVLMLGKNRLTAISGLGSLARLDVLDLHSNLITEFEGVHTLSSLRVLNVAGNRLRALPSLVGLNSLLELNVRRNAIATLGALAHGVHLARVYLSHNRLESLDPLATLPALRELHVSGNPCVDGLDESRLRMRVLALLPSLVTLDGMQLRRPDSQVIASAALSSVAPAHGRGEFEVAARGEFQVAARVETSALARRPVTAAMAPLPGAAAVAPLPEAAAGAPLPGDAVVASPPTAAAVARPNGATAPRPQTAARAARPASATTARARVARPASRPAAPAGTFRLPSRPAVVQADSVSELVEPSRALTAAGEAELRGGAASPEPEPAGEAELCRSTLVIRGAPSAVLERGVARDKATAIVFEGASFAAVVAVLPRVRKVYKRVDSLELSGSGLDALAPLVKLARLPALRALALRDAPVCALALLRPFIAHTLRSLETFNGERITAADRGTGAAVFGSVPPVPAEQPSSNNGAASTRTVVRRFVESRIADAVATNARLAHAEAVYPQIIAQIARNVVATSQR